VKIDIEEPQNQFDSNTKLSARIEPQNVKAGLSERSNKKKTPKKQS